MQEVPQTSPFSAGNRKVGLSVAAISLLVITAFDIWVVPRVSFGFLYLFPIVLAGGFLSRWQAVLPAFVCALLAEGVTARNPTGEVSPGVVITLGSFVVAGLFASQLGQNRRRLEKQFRELETQNKLRREAEEEFRALIETSAAAIITVDADGLIRRSNQSAERVLGVGGTLEGQQIADYLPFLGALLERASGGTSFRTMAEGRGKKQDGSSFFAQVWFSNYQTSFGPRLAAIISDSSEQVREREELGLRQLISSSSIFMGAMSHEVRNLCAAISVVYLNLQKNPALDDNPDFKALGSMVEGLRQMASSDLQSASEGDRSPTDLRELLEELSIIASPSAEDSGVKIEWEVPDRIPFVRAEKAALLQVLLNLLNNAIRAVSEQEDPRITIVAYALRDVVVVKVCNRGSGMDTSQDLFYPFHPGAAATGLGLYVSRAIVRTFGGELRYVLESAGNCFLVELERKV